MMPPNLARDKDEPQPGASARKYFVRLVTLAIL
jgi:hypothetical protein